jgi:hypothetical protein
MLECALGACGSALGSGRRNGGDGTRGIWLAHHEHASLRRIAQRNPRAERVLRAEGGAPQLILPLVVALAGMSTAKNVADQVSDTGPRSRRGVLRYLPAQIGIPDAYSDAEQDFIEVHHTIEHVDADRIVWLDLLSHRRRGWMASVIYDEETCVPLGRTTDLFGIVAEYRF